MKRKGLWIGKIGNDGSIDIGIESMTKKTVRDVNIVITGNTDIDHEVQIDHPIKTDILNEDTTETGKPNPKELEGGITKTEMRVLDETHTKNAAIESTVQTENAAIENEVHTTTVDVAINFEKSIKFIYFYQYYGRKEFYLLHVQCSN